MEPDPRLIEANERLLLAALGAQSELHSVRQQAQQLDALLASLHDGVIVLNSAGEITRANAVARRLFGWRARRKPTPPDAYHQLSLQSLERIPLPHQAWPFDRAAAGERFSAEHLLIDPSGRTRRLTFSGSAIQDPAGQVSCAVVVCRDVTEMRRLEHLNQQQPAMISHDLRSPLQTITLVGEVLEEALLARGMPGEAAQADVIVQSALHMGQMVNDLLHVAFLKEGGLSLRYESIDLPALISRVNRRLGPKRERVRVSLPSPRREGSKLTVPADGLALERVIGNLVTNALKYSADDAPVVVSVRRTARWITLSVTDQGIGIEPGYLSAVFGEYFRIDANGIPAGLGLGLYISRLIVQAHRGKLWVESEPGVGSTFHVSLPMREPAARGRKRVSRSAPSEA